ncbi:MAG: hypothetical protein AAGL69_02850 [Pseudomonadota bacterium]
MNTSLDSLANAMKAALEPGFEMPQPLTALFNWIDENHFSCVGHNGELTGRLASSDLLGKFEPMLNEFGDEIAERRFGGTEVLFAPNLGNGLHHWFGIDEQHPSLARISVFAQTGGDGSMAALWKDNAD